MLGQNRKHREPLVRKYRSRFFVEVLEERTMLDCGLGGTVLEDFDDPSLSAYTPIIRFNPSAFVYNGAGCDGGNALIDYDGDDWIIRNDAGSRISQGDFFGGAVHLGGAASGRAYLGFGSIVPAVNDRLITGRTLSIVLAPNTNQFMIQQHLGYKLHTSSNFSTLATANYTYTMDSWYFVFGYWGVGGGVNAYLLDINGDLVSQLAGTQAPGYTNTQGGLAFRGFGDNAYYIWDGITNYGGAAPGPGPGGFLPKITRPQAVGADVLAAIPLSGGQSGGQRGVPHPFQYVSVPGTIRDIQLENISGLTMTSCTPGSGPSCLPDNTFGGMVGLTATNTSRNMANRTVAWGPSLVNHFSNDTPQTTPNFQMYLYRMDPGQPAIRIGESGIKAFWSSTWGYDYQFIAPAGVPGDQDTYGTGHNANRQSYTDLSNLDPVTGERYDYSPQGTRNINGIWVHQNRTFNSPFQYQLQVSAVELNPANHPGARYFLAANIYVVGDRLVNNNSRWLEYNVLPTAQQNRYTFQPIGSQRLDICTIPGLPQIGRCATGGPGVPGGDGAVETPSATPVDGGQVMVTTLLSQPVSGFSVVAIQQPRASQEEAVPVVAAPVDQVFAGLAGEEEVAVALPTSGSVGQGDLFEIHFGGGGC